MFLPQGARDDTNSIVQIIHHPLGKLPATERSFQDWTMQSFGGKRGIRKEHVEKALWKLPATAADLIVFPSMFLHARVCVCVRMSGSSVCSILHARILEWTAMPSSGGIVPTQGRNPGLPRYRQILHHRSHQGTPGILEVGSLSLLQGIFKIQ